MHEIYDLVIAGAGTAGMSCAIAAAKRNLKVLVLDKDSNAGGTLHITAGHLSAAGTRRQKEKGINDHPDLHYADVMRISRNTAIAELVQKAVNLAPLTVDWLEDLGYIFQDATPVIIHGHEPYSIPRTYFGREDYQGKEIKGSGKAVLNTLLPVWNKLVKEDNIVFKPMHALTGILMQSNKAIGIEAIHQTQPVLFYGKKIVLATGGYASNQQFFSEHVQTPRRLLSTAKETSTGDGILAAIHAGAVFHGAEKHISTLGGIETEPGSGRASFWDAWARVSNSIDRAPREIYINENGKRFMNEHDLTVDERERIVLQQPNQRFWALFDETSLQAGPCIVVQWTPDKLKEEAKKENCCWCASTIEELALKTGVPAVNLTATIQSYNEMVVKQNDTDFGRTNLVYPILQPPFYALLTYAYSLISFGGIKVNEQLQVMRNDNRPIENLYAAGEILGAGATSGNSFCGGMLLTPAISFGKWLGETLQP